MPKDVNMGNWLDLYTYPQLPKYTAHLDLVLVRLLNSQTSPGLLSYRSPFSEITAWNHSIMLRFTGASHFNFSRVLCFLTRRSPVVRRKDELGFMKLAYWGNRVICG